MIADTPPFLWFFLGAAVVPFFRGGVRNLLTLAVPALVFGLLLMQPEGDFHSLRFLGFDLTVMRVDRLSRIFGYVFALNGFAAFLYAYYVRDARQNAAALLYMGGAMGVVFAGDLLTLYFFWEVMAVASTILILARQTPQAMSAGVRYVLIHLMGGLVLLAGIVFKFQATGSLAFTSDMFLGHTMPDYLILAGILINAAAPPLHAWLSDAYPEATVT